ncbi:MAG TPA: hypothetical protein GX693_04745 [Firmicutes bacterium]|nr:hypothetical protein [Bacillota bacterium]
MFKGYKIFIGVDLSSGFYCIEGSSMLWDELCAFQGLDSKDIENYYCVAQYISCLKRINRLEEMLADNKYQLQSRHIPVTPVHSIRPAGFFHLVNKTSFNTKILRGEIVGVKSQYQSSRNLNRMETGGKHSFAGINCSVAESDSPEVH